MVAEEKEQGSWGKGGGGRKGELPNGGHKTCHEVALNEQGRAVGVPGYNFIQTAFHRK